MQRVFVCMGAAIAALTASTALAQYPNAAPPQSAQQFAIQPATLPQPVTGADAAGLQMLAVQNQPTLVQAGSGGVAIPPHAYAGQSFTQTTIGAPTLTTQGPQLQPVMVPPTQGVLTAMSPLPATAMTMSTYNPAPIVHQHQQSYVPSYYWYYYQPPYQATALQPVAIAPQAYGVMAMPGMMSGGGGMNGGGFGPMSNARGEMGHVRYPYYSYRRPWYYPGQPSFNVTIDGPVW